MVTSFVEAIGDGLRVSNLSGSFESSAPTECSNQCLGLGRKLGARLPLLHLHVGVWAVAVVNLIIGSST